MAIRTYVVTFRSFAISFLAFAVLVAAGTYAASPISVLHDVASVARMPVPGTAEADLAARGYGLYFGTRIALRVGAFSMPK